MAKSKKKRKSDLEKGRDAEPEEKQQQQSPGIMEAVETLRGRLLAEPTKALEILKSLEGSGNSLLPAVLELLAEFDQLTVVLLLGELVGSYKFARSFAESYLSQKGSPLTCFQPLAPRRTVNDEEPKTKKSRKDVVIRLKNGEAVTTSRMEEILRATFYIIKHLPSWVYNQWDVSGFLDFNGEEFTKELRWYASSCAALMLSMSELEKTALKRLHGLSKDDCERIEMKIQLDLEQKQDFCLTTYSGPTVYSKGEIYHLEEDSSLLFYDGVVIKQKNRSEDFCSNVQFPSFLEKTKDIILHVLNDQPVCVVGPIGSGKSTVLRHVFSLFGRSGYPDMISVQMNDQIDSRVILGSYHSTDLPGQFVWKPGCLTKAVLSGNWIIFEDIDAAPSDVITLLNGFADTKKLSVPGYGDIDRIHPDFKMFSTCRRQLSEKHGLNVARIGKFWRRIAAPECCAEDLKVIVNQRFPYLRPIVDVLVNIFQSVRSVLLSMKKSGGSRLVSTRDFLKFCHRIPLDLDFTATSAAITIFHNGLDMFVLSMSDPVLKEAAAEVIGTQLNLLKSKSEYLLTMHHPSVSLCHNSYTLVCGRYSLPLDKLSNLKFRSDAASIYSLTKRTCNTLEAVAGFIKCGEPVLLVGETGVGKTSCVQYLANILHQKLIVVNLNRQSDSIDLLGGYKPVELKYIFLPLREEFEELFAQTFKKDSNAKYLNHIMTCFMNKRWKDLIKLMKHVEKSVILRSSDQDTFVRERWITLFRKLSRVENQMEGEESPFAFSFIEGSLIKALKEGYWILLDEINLATSEMLQCLAGVLDEFAQIHLWEKGDDQPIQRHENFRLFAAMNPSTDVGKKDLPIGIRNRFSELYVAEISDPEELRVLVGDYLKELCLSSGQINSLVQFYLKIRKLAQTSLVDGLGKRPHYSLRTLCRALKISSMNMFGSVLRSLYESFCLSFLTQLDFESHPIVEQLVAEHVYGKTNIKSVLNQSIPQPNESACIKVEGYWIPKGNSDIKVPENYILTSSIRRNLKDIARIVSVGKLPVLIQGETSVGKTSLIQYLANCSGNRCYRINNHQHTDLQEYIGSYQSDSKGKLVFAEGVLVQAMRKGDWIILDELNLAPSEVLEALNRLLDDNRQLFIAETGVTVTAHPRFMLFATQNPPGLYGGRKVLSRAFRNRFVELHFDEIPSLELENILHVRCAIPVSYCKKIIGVLKDLQVRRKASAALQGKHGFATLRDLFRWAERYRLSGEQQTKFYDWDQHLADEGYLVLGGKERKELESEVIREVLEKRFKRQVDPNNLFSLHEKTSTVTRDVLSLVLNCKLPEFRHIVWTSQMRRLAVLIGTAMKFKEPILLVGETGCGKTTVVQLLSQLMKRTLYCVNCHMNSEGSDFIGGLRPVREHKEGKLFEWVDGPLIEAMDSGGIFLADEISLADDSVLERLNSVLEPERTLLVAEQGEENPRLIVAHDGFHFIGTMNPGGDYGKKELSPALRNRLTEIWCESTTNEDDLSAIIQHNLTLNVDADAASVARVMVSFVKWLHNNELGKKCIVSIRDYLSWVFFLNHVISTTSVNLKKALFHGACMNFLDGLGTGNTGSDNHEYANALRLNALGALEQLFEKYLKFGLEDEVQSLEVDDQQTRITNGGISCGQFFIARNPFAAPYDPNEVKFAIDAPTTSTNAMRILRAMQLSKPILLEGSPGVGKTALVSALAKVTGFSLIRINLSEQTDISDLFGADLPVEGKEGGHFEWRDGPLLQALKSQSWILLDELNLASQSVLEGLNACLDHRGTVYIPELNRTFHISDGSSNVRSRIFGCQNPVRQGGARKGLPKSFLNRFVQVYVDALSEEDFDFVLQKSFPILPSDYTRLMSTFATRLHASVCKNAEFGSKGGPWDMNLRDLMRWAELTASNRILDSVTGNPNFSPEHYVDIIYGLRMRSTGDRRKVIDLFCETAAESQPSGELNSDSLILGSGDIVVTSDEICCGRSTVLRRTGCCEIDEEKLLVLRKDVAQLEAIVVCLQMGWMPILVGPSGCGKTSLVKLVAELSGRRLQTIHPSPEMDTIELLGGFEQADIYRRVHGVKQQLEQGFQQVTKALILSGRMEGELIETFLRLKSLPHLSPGELAHEEELKRIWNRVDFLQAVCLKCKSFVESESRNLLMFPSSHENKGNSSSSPTCVETGLGSLNSKGIEQLQKVSMELEQISSHLKTGIQTGAFHWIDSRLIKAMESGDWLLIDGANRCSAAVLDRLNSLMEPNGSILLSERGSIDGNILEIKPHPEFRLILTVDPTYGEISRAMRNRGVEIYMGAQSYSRNENGGEEINDPDDQTTVGKVLSCSGQTLKNRAELFGVTSADLNGLLKSVGLRNSALRKFVIELFMVVESRKSGLPDSPDESRVKIISFGRELVQQLELGVPLSEACTRSLRNLFLHETFEVVRLLPNVEEMLPKMQTSEGSVRTIPLLAVAFQNFLSAGLFRIWKSVDAFEEALVHLQEGCVPDGGGEMRHGKKLIEDFMIVSVFSKVMHEDSGRLASLLSLRHPIKASFISRISTKYDSLITELRKLEQEDSIHVGMRAGHENEGLNYFYMLKLSLILSSQIESLNSNQPDVNPRKGTLGWILKNLRFSDAGPLFEFLQAFSALANNFFTLYQSGLNESNYLAHESESASCMDFTQVWYNGVKSLVLGRLLTDLCHEKCDSLLPDEKLLANMNLIVDWIEREVLPTLSQLKAPTIQRKMQTLVGNCFKSLSVCREESLLKRNKTYRDSCPLLSLARADKFEESGQLMQALQIAWSLDDSVSKSRILEFFMSEKSATDVRNPLLQICAELIRGTSPSSEMLSKMLQSRDDLKALHEQNETGGENIVQQSVLGLKECFRLSSPEGGNSSTVFSNPLLEACKILAVPTQGIVRFLEWLDCERFRDLFIDISSVTGLQVYRLSPLYTARILVDQRTKLFRIPTLECNDAVRSSSESLSEMLSKELTLSCNKYDSAANLGRQIRHFEGVLLQWKPVITDCPNLLSLFDTWLSSLEEAKEKVVERPESLKRTRILVELGMTMIEASSLMMEISSYLPGVDPVVEKEVMANYLEEQVGVFLAWIQSNRLQHFTSYGTDIFEEKLESSLLHPFLSRTAKNVQEDRLRLSESKEGIIPRPKPPTYNEIMKDIQQFIGSFGAFSRAKSMTELVRRLLQDNSSPEQVSSVIVQCQNWLDCHRNFARKVFKKYLYWDITAGFLDSSAQAAYGYQLLCDSLQKHFASTSTLDLVKTIAFPPSYDKQTVSVSGIYEEPWAYQRANKSIFISSITSFSNKLKSQGFLSQQDVLLLQNYCIEFSLWWTGQEDEKRKKKEEEDAFYVYKGKEKAIEKSDDEQEEYDIANSFPSFESDYEDLKEIRDLSDGFHGESFSVAKGPAECGELTVDDVEIFLGLVGYACSLVGNSWLSKKPSDQSPANYVDPFLQRFQIGCCAFAGGIGLSHVESESESEFILSSVVASHLIKTTRCQSNWNPSTYDFYYDPNISEAQKLESLFKGMKVRIAELLAQWPDHPALQQIVKIIARIESFPIDSPIMKFLTGLEFLLGTCQEWEKVASQRVSIANHLEELTGLIITWRKLELRFWKNLLEHTFNKHKSAARVWWFHLYSVLMELVNEKKDSTSILELLHRFVESSTIGEFELRLDLLECLHRYMTLLEAHSVVKLHYSIPSVIWNTLQYYSSFREKVQSKLKSLRDPIEKKLKDFMKISRWNDSNFYALMDSVKKSQKTLNKLTNEFKKVLQTPVSSVLVAEVELQKDEEKRLKYKPIHADQQSYIVSDSVYSSFEPSDQQASGFSGLPLRQKRFKNLPKILKKTRTVFIKTSTQNGLSALQESSELNELTTTIVEKVHELQNQYVPDSGPQRKKALHNVHNLRRKGLAELFKALQEIGLSFKKGVIKLQNLPENAKIPYNFSHKPLDLSSGWAAFLTPGLRLKKLKSKEGSLLHAWGSCDKYFQGSVARMSALMTAFMSPSKELGTMINERCKGFSVELFSVISGQRSGIADCSSALWELKLLTEQDVLQSDGFIVEGWKEEFLQKICQLEYFLAHYKLCFESLQSLSNEKRQQLLILVEQTMSKIVNLKSKFNSLTRSLTLASKVFTQFDFVKFEEACDIMKAVCTLTGELSTLVPASSVLETKLQALQNMGEGCFAKMQELKNSLDSSAQDSNLSTKGNFKTLVNKTLDSVLLGFQKLKKFEASTETTVHNSTSFGALKCLDVETVHRNLTTLRALILKKLKRKEDCHLMIFIYNSIKPIVTQYVLTYQYHFTAALEYHRECSKLAYILSGIFATLAQKGFCLPSDYKEEAAEEGAEMDAKSGMGMGEGETTSDAKDVSDRFETEDQLEDTLKAGESVDPADKDLRDEEGGIEMGDDFEGKQQEKQKTQEGNEEDEEDSGESDREEDFDKQMGDVDGEEEDVVDDKMWGGSSDEEDEEDNRESNEGKGVSQNQEPEIAPKDSEKDSAESKPESKDNQPAPKDHNELDENAEPNDDQADPYHGQNAVEEEPEPMDLPDNLNLDGDNEELDKEGEGQEENPFDLDASKDDIEDFQDVDEPNEENKMEQEGEKEISDGEGEDMDTETPQLDQQLDEEAKAQEDPSTSKDTKIDDEANDEVQEQEQPSEPDPDVMAKDNEQAEAEDTAEPSSDQGTSADNTKDKESANQDNNAPPMQSVEEEEAGSSEKSTGQVNSEDGRGEEGKSVNKEQAETMQSKKKDETSRKPGETDEDRTLATEECKTRLKTVKDMQQDSARNENEQAENDENSEMEADLYQHIKESEKHDTQTIDNATKDQMNEQKSSKPEEKSELLPEIEENEEKMDTSSGDELDNLQEAELDQIPPDLIKGLPQDKKRKKKKEQEMEVDAEENIETPGEKVPTYGARGPADSTIHTQLHLLDDKAMAESGASTDFEYKVQSDNYGGIALMQEWHELESKTTPLSQELCEQLRLVLEPTQASKLKGDYKTGKRLNMRKVIPYIASGFRKDKIWLRRTQPSKREYQILLALDDSASMSDNQSKQMAFSAVAVVAKALSLLEVGQLAVASFGEDVQLLHPFEDSFTDFSGARLMQKFTFAQRKTRIVQLMETSTNLFHHAKQSFGSSSAPVETAQLLLIISDGRAVCHEGIDAVKNSVKKAMDQNIFTVFVIVDNPENQHSILDIQKPIFQQGKSVQFIKYMDEFPFPFYLILRDLSALPSVLSDALRQWFELVTSSNR